LFLRPTD